VNIPLVLECTPQMASLLDALLASGMFGPTRETVAQRLLELKMYEMSMSIAGSFLKGDGK